MTDRTTDRDIYTSAKSLIDEYGDLATQIAMLNVSELSRAGDDEGAIRWRRISRAISTLESPPSVLH